jgi:hypothetical protein
MPKCLASLLLYRNGEETMNKQQSEINDYTFQVTIETQQLLEQVVIITTDEKCPSHVALERLARVVLDENAWQRGDINPNIRVVDVQKANVEQIEQVEQILEKQKRKQEEYKEKQAKRFRKLLLACFLGWKGLPEEFPACLEALTTIEHLEAWAKTWDVSWYGRRNGLCGEQRVVDTLLHIAYWIRTTDKDEKYHVEGDRKFLYAFAHWIISIQATFQIQVVQLLANSDARLILKALRDAEREEALEHDSFGSPRTDYQQNAFELVLSFSRCAAEHTPGYWVTLAFWICDYFSEHDDHNPNTDSSIVCPF